MGKVSQFTPMICIGESPAIGISCLPIADHDKVYPR